MNPLRTLLTRCATAALVTAAAAQTGTIVTRDVVYIGDADRASPQHTLDVHAPPGADAAPVLVFVHGGGWRTGDKASAGAVGPKRDFFVGRGFVYVSINYRLAPAVHHPAQVEDVAAALAWVHDHVEEYGGDPDHVVLIGHSAGAHLGALVATDPRRLGAHQLEPGWLDGVVLLDGAAYDLRAAIAEPTARVPRAMRMYENAFGPPGPAWLDAAPLEHVTDGRRYPPFLLVHAGARQASANDAAAVAARLRAAGGQAELFHAADKNHAGANRDLGVAGEPLTDTVAAFVDRCVAPAPDFARVDEFAEGLVATGVVPGVSLVVLTRAGGVVHEFVVGTGDLDAVIPIASATKIAGATVAMALADRGALAVDDPVSKYIDGFGARAPTIAQCLSCTSGLGSRGMFRARRADSLAAGVAAIASAARLLRPAAPGTEFSYGGAGFQVAGRVCEVAAGGVAFAELFDTLVAGPLGLQSWEWGARLENPDLGGGARCSVRDYARLVALHLGDGEVGGVRVLSEDAARAMRADRRGACEVAVTPYEDAAGYGLGWWILPAEGDARPEVFADPGAFGATPWIDVGRGYGAVLFLHGEAGGGRPPRGGFRTAKQFLPQLIDAVAAAFDR